MFRTVAAASVGAVILVWGSAACAGPTHVAFPAGTTMDRLHNAGKITIGVKYDQPLLGFKNPATGRLEGFDIHIAEIVAAELGLTSDQITFVETPSKERESALEQGHVDLVVASYSITADRRRYVGQAGPYFVTGQRLLVREEDKNAIKSPNDLSDARVCSVTGSTASPSAQQRFKVRLVQFTTYTDCVRQLLDRSVRAVLTDEAVLLGYAAQQPNKLAIVGEPVSPERYGIGYPKGDLAFCQFLTDTIRKAEGDGSWDKAFEDTMGTASASVPAKPTPDPCQA